MNNASYPPHAQALTTATLRRWPLPPPDPDGDKEDRGRVLIVGGSREIPGAAHLAANAALRAGAGKVTVATCSSVAPCLGAAIPELRVIGLRETEDGGIALDAMKQLLQLAARADAVLIGPGMQDADSTAILTRQLLAEVDQAAVILDALAMDACLGDGLPPAIRNVLLTPHAGEMSHLTGLDRDDVRARPAELAQQWANSRRQIIALKGATTWIAVPDGELWVHEAGNPGLAVSGSGDTLAGIIAGIAARGVPLQQACAWGVVLHAQAGQRLAERQGAVGFLAREIPGEIPALMQAHG